tara:strand:+ start:512 stop:811 length:300 start_codon:yes stop_codon:yes gene_type:complete
MLNFRDLATDSEDKKKIGKKQGWAESYTRYWITNPLCEMCFGTAVAPAHIKSRGSGGSDESSNLLSLCLSCHQKQHNKGWSWVISHAPDLKEKIHEAQN